MARTVTIEVGEYLDGNGAGTRRYDAETDMQIFDALPPDVRKVMADAAYLYSAKQVQALLRKHGGETEGQLTAFCDIIDYHHLIDLGVEAFGMYGPGHPQANVGNKRKIRVHPNSLLVERAS